MASSSLTTAASSQPKESDQKKKEGDKKDGKSKEENKDMHVKLDYEFIEYLKKLKNWPEMEPPIEKSKGTALSEEQIAEMSKRAFDLDDAVQKKLLDEEIVWEEDVWAMQHSVGFPNDHAKEAKKN